MPEVAHAIQLDSLRKTYRSALPWARREVHAVQGLSLDVERGEILGLLGPNGAGKTTTIKMLAGLVDPDGGRIAFPAFGRRPVLGTVLEGSRNLYWRLSPWENIRYFGEIKGVPLRTLRSQGNELLSRFALADRRHRPAQTLSRGMQQKLAVVLALLGEPEILLLDEPTLGLDVASSLAIQDLLRQLRDERGLTIIVTTHQMDVAQAICHRVAIMREGRIAACAPVRELVDHFKRQDYIARFDQARWAAIEPDLAGVQYELVDQQRPDQVSVRFKLPAATDLYPLLEVFARHRVELHDFHQESPTLEDIFLSITGSGA